MIRPAERKWPYIGQQDIILVELESFEDARETSKTSTDMVLPSTVIEKTTY